MKPAYTTETGSASPIPAFDSLSDSLNSSSGLMLLMSLSAILLVALLNTGSKAKLASGRWAKPNERKRAFHQSICQIKTQKFNKMALSMGPPGDPAAQHLPDVQRGISIVGAPGVGKTFGGINPLATSALLQGHPLILFDAKYPKQASELAPLAEQLGYDVHIFVPGFQESAVCNPLDFIRDDEDITMSRQLAKVIVKNTARGGRHNGDSDPYFTEAGENLAVGLMALAKSSPYPDLAMAHAIVRLPELAERLKQGTDLPLWARLNFDQLIGVTDSEKTAASIISTALGMLTRLMAPTLLSAFIGETTLPMDLEGRQMIIIGMDKERRDAIAPLVATVLHLLVMRNVAKPRSLPLIAIIDELPTLYLPSLVQWINEFREQGLAIVLGFQNLAQLEQTYGQLQARAIFGACATKLLFNPGEPDSAKIFSDYLGDEEVQFTDPSRTKGSGRTTTGRQLQRRPRRLFEPNQFLSLPTGHAVLISPGVASKQKASLPVQLNIKVPDTTINMIEASKAAWPRLLSLLREEKSQQPNSETTLRARLAYAEELLPLTGENSRSTGFTRGLSRDRL